MFIFTSFGFVSPVVAEKLKRYINPQDRTILIVPFAGFHFQSCAEREKRGLLQFGFAENQIFVYDFASIECIRQVDYIYVPGGETFKLLAYSQRYGVASQLQRLIRAGADYIGASAGAEFATADMQYVTQLEDERFHLTDYTGLGLTDELILPHADQVSLALKMKCRELAEGKRKMLCIANGDIAIYENRGLQSEFKEIITDDAVTEDN